MCCNDLGKICTFGPNKAIYELGPKKEGLLINILSGDGSGRTDGQICPLLFIVDSRT